MRYGYVVGIDFVCGVDAGRFGRKMSDDLVAEKIEIDPTVRTASLAASQHAAVKFARGGKIADWKCQMEKVFHFKTPDWFSVAS
jgi:hypothetical protein